MPQKDTQSRRIPPLRLQKATDALTTLSKLSNYNPQRAEYNLDKIVDLQDKLKKTHDAELAAEKALDKARDAAAKAEWDVYNFMQGAAEQVIGQYGTSSDEYAALGYKKKTEYKRAAPKPKQP